MPSNGIAGVTGLVLLLAAVLVDASTADVANPYAPPSAWGTLPADRPWGATSAIYPGRDGSVWVADRCGQNGCVDRDDVDPVLRFDRDGHLLTSFGRGRLVWPHGIFEDAEGNVWVTDARVDGRRGHQVHKFSPMADGHAPDGNNRIVKFDRDGRLLDIWGRAGTEAGEFREPHALAMDDDGRLFVADRGNSRIQIFLQDGTHVASWTQFGRPSGLFIRDGVLYAADAESHGAASGNRGFRRGIYIGSLREAAVTAFIPDPTPTGAANDPAVPPTTGAEGVMVDADGNVYGAEVSGRRVVKYALRR
jgi:streptogramin lyase